MPFARECESPRRALLPGSGSSVPPCLRGEDSDSLPDRAAVPAGTVGPVGFPAESRKSDGAGARPCDLAHSVPPTSPGTTTMPAAKMSGSQAAGNARLAAVQFGCDSTRRQWIGGGPAGVPSGPDEFAVEGTWSYMSQPAVRLDNSDHHVLPTHMRSTPYTKAGFV